MDKSYLNRPQKRTQATKDELTYMDTRHLDSFLDGVGEIEPPRYRHVGGKIQPDLAMVELKKNANVYDLDNVYYDDTNEVKQVELRVDGGRPNIQRKGKLPQDERVFLSIPIPQFIAQSFLPVWRDKYQKIVEHKNHINDTRRYAHHLLNRQAPSGQSSGRGNLDASLVNGANSRKRASGELIARHPSNKRARVGLLAIQDSTKCEAFAKIDHRFKVGLFDAMIKTAFPGFDNVMIAAWNSVSVYSTVGSEFPEFHKVMTELKTALEEFGSAHGDGKDEDASQPKQEPEPPGTPLRNGRSNENSAAEDTARNGKNNVSRDIRQDRSPASPVQRDGAIESVEITIPRGSEFEAQHSTSSAVRDDQEASDEESRQSRFTKMLDIHRSQPRYTPSHRRQDATHSDNAPSEHQDEDAAGMEELFGDDGNQDEHPVDPGRGDETISNHLAKELPESLAPEHRNQLRQQQERDAPSYDGQKEHHEKLSSNNQNGRSTHDSTKHMWTAPRQNKMFPIKKSLEHSHQKVVREEPREEPRAQTSSTDSTRETSGQGRPMEVRKPQGQAEKPKGVWLGPTKLGPKKPTAANNGSAPVAPMMHMVQNSSQQNVQKPAQNNIQHTVRKDQNGTERRRP